MRYTRSSEESKGPNIHGFEDPRTNETYDTVSRQMLANNKTNCAFLYMR